MDVKVKSEVFLSCKKEKYQSKEMVIGTHAFMRILSGETKLVQADNTYVFGAGATILLPRNQIIKMTKSPLDGVPFRSIAIYFTQSFLHKYYSTHEANLTQHNISQIKVIEEHPLIENLFNSLLPYFTLADELPPDIAALKVEEAIAILRSVDKDADTILAHFDEPGKIELSDFMNKNYMFNMSAEKFAYLTGRSLTTFKKDFKKTFNTTPQKWLTHKRLELAHLQIFENKRKPSDVYFEVGFENLSHFSFAFKKQFGYNPTTSRASNS